MTRVDHLLSVHEKGALTRHELFFMITELVTRDNINSIMSKIPEELLPGFKDWVFKTPVHGAIVFPPGAKDVPEGAVQTLRDWFHAQAST